MKILVCVKQVPDVDLVKMDPETGNLIRAGVPTMLNPLDGNALEAALRVKEKYGAEVTVITMGPPMAESTLRDCLAVGADKAVLISGRPFGGADTLSTSYTIAAAAAMEGSFDLVFAGKESVDGATGQMGPQLAERMSMAQITNTLLIDEIDENAGTIVAERETDAGVEVIEAKLPCLLTIEKTPGPERKAGRKKGKRDRVHRKQHRRPGARAHRRARLRHDSAGDLSAQTARTGTDDRRGQRRGELGQDH